MPGFEPGTPGLEGEGRGIAKDIIDDYISLRRVGGRSKSWVYNVRGWLVRYAESVEYNITKKSTIAFLLDLQERYPITYYRKIGYQIRRFLQHLGINWAMQIKMPPEQQNDIKPRYIVGKDIINCIGFFYNSPHYNHFKAMILLGATSGMRAYEVYALKREDIDIDNRAVYISKSKSGRVRTTFFNQEAKEVLIGYIDNTPYTYLFGKVTLQKHFRNASIKVKDLRKFFSQEWDRRLGPTGVKKRLMGHSIRGDVDLQHYSYLDTDDLKKIYDKVIPEYMLTKP